MSEDNRRSRSALEDNTLVSSLRRCSDKIRLVAAYGAAVAAYYAAISALEEGMITGSAQVYEARYRDAETARLGCEAARQDLENHIASHGC